MNPGKSPTNAELTLTSGIEINRLETKSIQFTQDHDSSISPDNDTHINIGQNDYDAIISLLQHGKLTQLEYVSFPDDTLRINIPNPSENPEEISIYKHTKN